MVDGRTRTGRVVNRIKNSNSVTPQGGGEQRTPIATDMYLPNNSGMASHPEAENNFVRRPPGKSSTDLSLSIWNGTDARVLNTTAIVVEDGETLNVPGSVKTDFLDEKTSGADIQVASGVQLDMNTNKIIGVVDPTSNQDAATKKYVDDNAGGTVNKVLSYHMGIPSSTDRLPMGAIPNASTISRIWAKTDAGTVTLNVAWKPDATVGGAGTDTLTSDLVADSNGEASTTFTDATIPANSWLQYESSATSGTPTEVYIYVEYTED